MTSPAQTAPDSATARPCAGPRIVPSNARSSRYRLTQGLCGPHTVLPGEDAAEHEHLLNALLEDHKPAGPSETLLVAQLAQAQWKLNRIAAIEGKLFAKQMQPFESAPDPDGDMAPPVPSANSSLQFEPNLSEAFEKTQTTLASLARHESAAHRAFDKALANLWKPKGPHHHDVEDAAQAELEGFVDADVNGPMRGSDGKQNHDGDGVAAKAVPTAAYDNWNPISEQPPAWLEPPTTRSYIERHPESDTPSLPKAGATPTNALSNQRGISEKV